MKCLVEGLWLYSDHITSIDHFAMLPSKQTGSPKATGGGGAGGTSKDLPLKQCSDVEDSGDTDSDDDILETSQMQNGRWQKINLQVSS